MNKAKILVVEDDKAVRNLITTTLETQNYQYHTAEKGSEALLEAVSFQPDRKSTRLNSSHYRISRMPSSA